MRLAGLLFVALVFAACDPESPLRAAAESDAELSHDINEPPTRVPVLGPIPGSEGSCPNGVRNPRLDVLVILDDSQSMQDSQTEMKQQAARLVGRLAQLNLDYHLALTTTSLDGARRVPGALVQAGAVKVITRKDSLNAARDFWALLDAVDTKGGAQEYGLLTASLALSTSAQQHTMKDEFGNPHLVAGALDPDFVRPDARTLVVIISDEDDESTVPTHPRELLALRPAKADLRVVAIVDPSDGPKQGCKSSSAWTGTPAYHDAMMALDGRGQIVDFCAELEHTVDLVALLALEQSCAE